MLAIHPDDADSCLTPATIDEIGARRQASELAEINGNLGKMYQVAVGMALLLCFGIFFNTGLEKWIFTYIPSLFLIIIGYFIFYCRRYRKYIIKQFADEYRAILLPLSS